MWINITFDDINDSFKTEMTALKFKEFVLYG